jgi:hypothetical protein
VFVKPQQARNDPHWGPLLSRVLSERDHPGDFISHGSGIMVLNARQIEPHFAIRDPWRVKSSKGDPQTLPWVGILHGLAPLDPLGLRDGDGTPLFAPPYRLPSGVLAFAPNASYAQEHGLLAPTLFITVDGTYIITEGVSAPRMRDMLAQNGAAPPPLTASSASLGGAVMGVTSIRFLNSEKHDRAALTQGMTAAGLGLNGGAGGSVEGYADYASTADAERAYDAFQRLCADKPKACVLEPGMFRDARAERDGSRIVVTLAFSEATLQSLHNLGR